MGLLWALGGVAVGGLIELIDNLVPSGFARQVDMWPQTLALLAFPRGLVFGAVVAWLGRGRRLGDFSYRQFSGWGTAAGLAVSALTAYLWFDIGQLVVTTALSALGGAGTLAAGKAIARREASPMLSAASTE